MSGLKIDHSAWVMVGDGEKALFLRNEGDAAYPNLQVVNVFEQDNPLTHEQESDWYTLERRRFAEETADRLYSAAHCGRYSEFILAAPPMVMGDLRKALHKEVSGKVVAEVSKDLANMPPYEIERVLVGHS